MPSAHRQYLQEGRASSQGTLDPQSPDLGGPHLFHCPTPLKFCLCSADPDSSSIEHGWLCSFLPAISTEEAMCVQPRREIPPPNLPNPPTHTHMHFNPLSSVWRVRAQPAPTRTNRLTAHVCTQSHTGCTK